jgi:hypothetical protein
VAEVIDEVQVGHHRRLGAVGQRAAAVREAAGEDAAPGAGFWVARGRGRANPWQACRSAAAPPDRRSGRSTRGRAPLGVSSALEDAARARRPPDPAIAEAGARPRPDPNKAARATHGMTAKPQPDAAP